MKQHRFYPLAALLLAACLTLSSCGGSGAAASSMSMTVAPEAAARDYDYAAAEEMGLEMAVADDAAANSAAQAVPVDSARKIVRNAWLSLETKEFDQALAGLNALITEHGGYIESQSEDGRSLHYSDGYYSRSASITARIPADRLDAVIGATEGFCNITSRSISAEDITERYFDSDARLKSLALQEERLLDILSKAEKLDDVITLERALSEVRYQIESLTASLRRMDNQVAYSALHIDLSEVVDYRQPVSQPKSFGERIAAAWGRSVDRMGDIAEGLLFFAIESLPSILLFVALPILILLWIVRAVVRRRRDRNKPTPPPAPETPGKDA